MSGSFPLRGPSCTGEIRDESTVTVPVGKSILVPLIEPTRNRTLGNPAIVQATLVSPRTLYVVGMTNAAGKQQRAAATAMRLRGIWK